MNNYGNTQRKGWIDICKALLIVGVMLGHTVTNKVLLNFLSTFYMPCFFVLSGFLMKKDRNAQEFICKKIRSILLPYLFFAVIWVLFSFIKSLAIESDFKFFRALISIVLPYSGSPNGNAYNLWFLPCLFLAQSLVAIFIYGNNIMKIISGAVWALFFALGICIQPYCSLLYATAIACLFVFSGFIIRNYLFPKYKQSSQKHLQKWIVIIAGILYLACLIINVFLLKNTLDFSAGSFGELLLYLLGGLCGSLLVVRVASLMGNHTVLEYVGKNSLVYYALHYEVVAVVTFLAQKLITVVWVSQIVGFGATVLVTSIVVWLYNKAKIGKLFQLGSKND